MGEGLLGGFGDWIKTPEGQGLLSMVAGGLAGARKGAPLNSLGAAGMSGLMGYSNAQTAQARLAEEAQQKELRGLQIGQARTAMLDQEQARATAKQFFSPGVPGVMGDSQLPPDLQTGAAPMAGRQPSFDLRGYAQARMGQNPIEGMKLIEQLKKETPINKLDVKDFTPASVQKFAQTGSYSDLVRMDKLHFADGGGATLGLDPFTGQQRSASPKTGNPFNDLVLADGQGGFRPNSPLINAKQGIAKAGATSVRIENKTGESLAKEIGPMMTESAAAASGASQQIDAANRVISAVDSNKMFAGPGASIRLKGAQIAEMLGVGGKDGPEKIANTRQTVRGLAEMTLQGRKQMRGQGAITESESKLAERAISGDIDDLTAAEIRQLASASSRSARFVHEQHQKKLNVVKNNPNTAQLAPFYEAQALPEAPAAPAAPQATMRWNPKTNKLESVN